MAKKEHNPPAHEELVQVFPDMCKETDRGFALTATAWLDDALGELLRSQFVDHQASVDELLVGDAPLATFSAKIKMAFCLGLIDVRVKRDLNLIRAIRNEFAHHRGNLTFESESVKSRCQNFA